MTPAKPLVRPASARQGSGEDSIYFDADRSRYVGAVSLGHGGNGGGRARRDPRRPRTAGGGRARAWAPAVDISERKDAYLVAADLPGVKAGDVEITFEDGLLTIQGERHLTRDPSAEKVHRAERCDGAFRRSITLPAHVMTDAVQATAGGS